MLRIVDEITLNRRTGSGSDLAVSTDSTGVSALLILSLDNNALAIINNPKEQQCLRYTTASETPAAIAGEHRKL